MNTLRWLTSITRPVHAPLYASTLCRVLQLCLHVALFAGLGAGVAGVYYGRITLGQLAVVLGSMAVAKALLYYLEQFLGHYVAFRALELLRTHAFATLWPKAPGVVSRQRSGDVLASLTRDIDRIEVVYAHTFAPVVAGVIVPIIAVLVGAAVVTPLAVLPAAAALLVSVALVPWLGTRRVAEAAAAQNRVRRDLTHHVTDSVFGAAEVFSYGRVDDRVAAMGSLDDAVRSAALTNARYRAVRRAVNAVLPLLAIAGTLALLGPSAQNDPRLMIGLAGLIAGILGAFEAPRGIEDAAGALDSSLAAAGRLRELCELPTSVHDGSVTLAPGPVEIAFRDVTYAYGGVEEPVVKHLSFTVSPGEHVALVGPSGSGKSTALHLLARYDNPTSGEILVNGRPVAEYSLDSLRRVVAFVPQHAEVMNATIADNLRLAAPQATDEELWHVLEVAALADEVRALPRTLHTPLGGRHGVGLSGGQLQRLCLARTLLLQPSALVLDEFAAHLNVELEATVRERLAAAYPDMTVLEISHRRDSLADARIIDFS